MIIVHSYFIIHRFNRVHFTFLSSIFFDKCDVRSTVTVDQGCRSDHVRSLFSEVNDELTSVMMWIYTSDKL